MTQRVLEEKHDVKTLIENAKKKWKTNPMLKPKITKVTVNTSLGHGGERLVKIADVLEEITGQKPKFRKAKKTIRDFGIRRGENIAVTVTLRGEKAFDFLRRVFEAIGNRIKYSSFDEYGNISFGISEHINIPGVKYDPEIGVFGMDVSITIERPGYRVARRRVKNPSRIPSRHRVTRMEAAALLADVYGVTVI